MPVHYAAHTAVVDRSDRTRVELFYAATPIASPGLWSAMYNATFRVPTNAAPSDPTATVRQSVAVAAPLRLFGVAPHMHFMGTEIRVDVVHGDGSRECLVQIPRWDFHWQRSYWFAEPLQLVANANAHDTFELTCVYDNTPENQPIRDGRPGTSRPLIWGESSDDEMCLAFLYMGR